MRSYHLIEYFRFVFSFFLSFRNEDKVLKIREVEKAVTITY